MTSTTVPAIQQDPESWAAGYCAGASGGLQFPPPLGVRDFLAFYAGWLEGDADRKAGTARHQQQPNSAR